MPKLTPDELIECARACWLGRKLPFVHGRAMPDADAGSIRVWCKEQGVDLGAVGYASLIITEAADREHRSPLPRLIKWQHADGRVVYSLSSVASPAAATAAEEQARAGKWRKIW